MSKTQGRDGSYNRPGVPDEIKWQPVMRGLPEDMEVLTELGWIGFENLYRAGVNGTNSGRSPLFTSEVEWKNEHVPLRDNWDANRTKHQRPYQFAQPNQIDFTKWNVGGSFPKLATLTSDHTQNGVQHGTIEFIRPEFATRFTYHNHQLIHFKRRGVDIHLPRYTEILTKSRFQSVWRFTVADDFCTVKNLPAYFKSIVNRYTPQGTLFGEPDAETLRELVEAGELKAMMTDEYPAKIHAAKKQVKKVRIYDAYPDSGNSLECYNFTLPKGSSHTLIVRRKGRVTNGEQPSTLWTGFPIIVGDGYDKSQIILDGLK